MTSMNVTGAGSTGAAAGTGSTGTSPSTSAATKDFDKDTFLKLLVAQLKYQDPTSPADATQFMSQTAQFTVIEKLDALSALDQKVLDATRAQSAASLIGRQVTYTDYSGTSRTGTVTGTSFGSQNPTLTIDGTQVAMDAVTAVGATAPPATGSSGSSGTSGTSGTAGSA
jgi:flagellar basal-body rod modification protein FlgD